MSTKTITIFLSLLLVLALIGVADSTYLTYEHFSGGDIVCSVVEGCNEVLESKYSAVGPVPVALAGILYYLVLVVLASMAFQPRHRKKALFSASVLSGIGVLTSLVFVYLQAAVIEAYCLYCLVSAVVTTLYFVTALVLYRGVSNILEENNKYQVIS